MGILTEARDRVVDTVRRIGGVSPDEALDIVAKHGDGHLWFRQGLGGGMNFVTAETFDAKRIALVAQGATQLEITVFRDISVALADGTVYAYPAIVGKYRIR